MNYLKNLIGLDKPMGRKKYFAFMIVLFILAWAIFFLTFAPVFLTTPSPNILVIVLASLIYLFLGVNFLYIYCQINLRRLDDANMSHMWLILNFLPYINFLFILFLCLKGRQKISAIS